MYRAPRKQPADSDKVRNSNILRDQFIPNTEIEGRIRQLLEDNN